MPLNFIKRRKTSTKRLKSTSCLNMSKLLIAGLPTIVFGLFTVVFTVQQDVSARATREQDQRQADEINRRVLFKDYIEDIKEMILSEDYQRNINESLLHIRVQTLTVLKNLDSHRKRDVIIFLYENRLIRGDRWPNVNLVGADLTNVRFIKSSTEACSLPYLYLPGVYAENIVFDHCDLTQAIFDDALLVGAEFRSCFMPRSHFANANLTRAQFHSNQLFDANFTSASLIQSSIEGGLFQKVDLTNADLFQSHVLDELLHPSATRRLASNIFLNSRYPDGSFANISTDDLIVNGRADFECEKNRSLSWSILITETDEQMMNQDDTFAAEIIRFNDRCFFAVKRWDVLQRMALNKFSTLIDLEQAVLNVSAFLGITNINDQDEVSMFVHFADDKSAMEVSKSLSVAVKNPLFFQYHSIIGLIPPGTRQMYVWFHCSAFNQNNQSCLFDQVQLSISKKK